MLVKNFEIAFFFFFLSRSTCGHWSGPDGFTRRNESVSAAFIITYTDIKDLLPTTTVKPFFFFFLSDTSRHDIIILLWIRVCSNGECEISIKWQPLRANWFLVYLYFSRESACNNILLCWTLCIHRPLSFVANTRWTAALSADYRPFRTRRCG